MQENITLNSRVFDSVTGREARVIALSARGMTIRFADYSALYLLDAEAAKRLTLAK